MEDFVNFIKRTNSFEKENFELDEKYFTPIESLKQKIKEDNTFKDFYGDTVVFALPNEIKEKISRVIDFIYSEAPECFAKRFPDKTLHMTLHDLVNSENLNKIQADITKNKKQVELIKKQSKIPNYDIQMKTNNIINMVNTSLVFAIQPCTQEDYKHLMELYNIFEEVKKLPYPFTPHITLAYYNINGFDEKAAKKLSKSVTKLNQDSLNKFEFCVSTKELIYQTFRNMEEYFDIIAF